MIVGVSKWPGRGGRLQPLCPATHREISPNELQVLFCRRQSDRGPIPSRAWLLVAALLPPRLVLVLYCVVMAAEEGERVKPAGSGPVLRLPRCEALVPRSTASPAYPRHAPPRRRVGAQRGTDGGEGLCGCGIGRRRQGGRAPAAQPA